jgi:Fic family protein
MGDQQALRASVTERRRELDRLRPLKPGAIEALRAYFDIELTWTSNAIEGNTLTARDTAELIAHGLTVGGERLRDHLEAEDLYAAVQWMRELADADTPVGELKVTQLSEDFEPYQTLMFTRLDDTLADYVGLLEEALP